MSVRVLGEEGARFGLPAVFWEEQRHESVGIEVRGRHSFC